MSEIEKSKRDEYKTKQMKNIEFKMMNFNRAKMRIEYKQKNRWVIEQNLTSWITLKKNKKIFLDSSPHRQPVEEGEGVRVKNASGIYSAGKYLVLAICVRTQIDFYLECGISVHPNNKTRLNRFICLHNGRYTRKQDGTRLKMNKYT